ncbi:MAG: phenylalanine--tRNA ligase subunit beta [Pseudomonadota bacterium]
MKFTLSWLADYLDFDADAAAIADRLTAQGLEVDTVEDRAAALAPFTVAYVKSAERHPNADRLQVCMLDTADGEVQVICGATNARAGIKAVFAPAGSHVPGTGVDLKKGKIRGVDSNGMICSEREMGLSDDHEGIIELPDDAPVGAPVAPLLGVDDAVIDIELTPDRGDCAGVLGIARDLAAGGLGTLKFAKADVTKGSFKSPIGVRFEFPEGSDHACPLFLGRTIRGVKNGPSPQWLQDRLRAVGLRPISTLVDITNLFTLGRARPLHVFDANLVKGDLVLHPSKGGEVIEALNDKTYTLPPGVTTIYDESGAVSIAGIVGGTSTGCTDQTTDVFLEAALFDPILTAESGRKLSVISDARYRFERGVDPAAVHDGIEAATALIIELCGGEASELVETGKVPDWHRSYTLRANRCANLGGLHVEQDEQARILTDLGFEITDRDADALTTTPPSWRSDVHGEADLVEEVLRIKGFDHVPAVSMIRVGAVAPSAVSESRRTGDLIRRTLAGGGLDEAVTYSFMSSSHTGLFGQSPPDLTLSNPISSEMDQMRPSILPNLILAAQSNADKGMANACLFEVGPDYQDPTEKGQRFVAAGVRSGQASPRHWTVSARPVDLYDVRSDVESALEAAGAPVANLQTTADAPDWYHPGRSGCLRLGANVLATFGEVHPAVLKALDADGPMAAFEIFIDRVPAPRAKGTERKALDLATLQPVERDFAFVVGETVTAGDLTKAVKGADKALIVSAEVFDVFRGGQLGDGQKSLAISVTLQPRDATFTDAEIETISQKIIANVTKQTGGVIRG